jgi:hypothetical protein
MINRRFNDRASCLARKSLKSALAREPRFYPPAPGNARGKPWLAGTWKSQTRRMSFDWRSKRDDTRIRHEEDGCLATFPILLRTALAESQGYKPADFDRLIEIAGDGSEFETVDERLLLEAQPDFMPWLPRE